MRVLASKQRIALRIASAGRRLTRRRRLPGVLPLVPWPQRCGDLASLQSVTPQPAPTEGLAVPGLAISCLLTAALLIASCGNSQSGDTGGSEEAVQVGAAGRSGEVEIASTAVAAANPTILGTVPPFSLTNEDGFTIDNNRLGGRVWVGSFIFTRCPATCPRLTVEFAKLQKIFRNEPEYEAGRLVSITVDPEYDTPAVLHRYARDFGADRQIWTFLTGDREAIWSLAQEGFKLAVHDAAADAEMVIAHSQHFVLVDRLGRIRGYYDGLDEEARARLLRDFLLVRDDPGWPPADE